MKYIAILLFVLILPFSANAQFTVPQGGTGTTTFPTGWFVTGSSALRLTAKQFINLLTDISGILPISNGGTGTSTAPTLGQILIGNGLGGYDYIASSTFGGGGGTNFFTNSGIFTYLTTGTNLGIGTATPSSILHLAASDAGTTLTNASLAMLNITNRDTTNGNFGDVAFSTSDTAGQTVVTSKIVGGNTSHTASATSGFMAFLIRNAGTMTEKVRFIANGNVGIGSSTPGAKLSIHDNSGSVASSTLEFSIASSTASNTATTTLFSVDGYGSTTIKGSVALAGGTMRDNNGSINLAVGISGVNKAKCGLAIMDNFAAGCASNNGALFGVNMSNDTNYAGYNSASFQRGSNVNGLNSAGANALFFTAQVNTTNNATAGFWNQTQTTNVINNSTSYAYISQDYLQGTGQLNTYVAFNSRGSYATAGPTVTNHYDFQADPFGSLANGTTTNRYGLYIGYDSTSITNPFGIFQLSPTVKNYLAGNLGLGSTSPTGRLTITGGVGSTTDLFIISSSSNTQLLNVTSNGSVGIGTTSPIAKLGITGNGLTTGLVFQTTNSSSVPQFNITDNGVVTALTSFGNLGGSSAILFPSGRMQFNSGGAGMLYLENGSNVHTKSDSAIGWGSNTTIATAIDTGFSRLAAATVGVGTGAVGNTSGTLIAGKIGIGTTTPGFPLVVVGTTTASCFSNDNGATCLTGGVGTNYWSSSGSSLFNNTGELIGLGTSTPSSRLSLAASTTPTGGINLGDALANLYRSADGMIRTDGGFTAGGGQFIVNGSGVITSSPGATFSNIYLRGTDITTIPAGSIGFTSANWYDAADTAISRLGANKLAIGNGIAGNVSGTLVAANLGLGSSTPSKTLTVVGDQSLSGALFDSTFSPGVAGSVLQSTVTGTQWVATSTLGLGGGGTVTSVGLTAPTGLSVSGSPVTTAGTLALSLTAGYIIPLTASTTEWAAAYASTTALTPTYIRGLFSNTVTGLTYTAATGVTSLTAGYNIPLTASTTDWQTAYTNRITSLTTTGTSGAATLTGNVLNIPQYTGASPEGTGSELQFRLSGTTFGAVATSSVIGGQLGLGTLSPLAVLSISTSTGANAFRFATSTTAASVMFNISATTTATTTSTSLLPSAVYAGISSLINGVRVTIGDWATTFGLQFDELAINGAINTGEVFMLECAISNSLTSPTTATANVCGPYAFRVDTSGAWTAASVPGEAGELYGGNNVGTGSGIFAGTGTWLSAATSTPRFEASVRKTANQDITRVGLFDVNAAGTSFEATPSNGCYFQSTTASGNWFAVTRNSTGVNTSVDTGIAMDLVNQQGFRINMNGANCNFYIRRTAFTWTQVSSSVATTTALLNAGVIQTTDQDAVGRVRVGSVRLWFRKTLWTN